MNVNAVIWFLVCTYYANTKKRDLPGGSETQQPQRGVEKKPDAMGRPKIGVTEADFIKINGKTQINERLAPSSFHEKNDQNTILDDELIASSRCSFENLEDKKTSSNQFLDFLQNEKRDKNYKPPAVPKKPEDFMTLSVRIGDDAEVNRSRKSRSIAHKIF